MVSGILGIGPYYLLGVELDGDNVPSVVGYRLVRRTAG